MGAARLNFSKLDRQSAEKLDFTLGDPLYPLTRIANHAFREASRDLNKYLLMSGRADHPDIGPQITDIARHFSARGFCAPGWTGLPTDHLMLTGGGTTESYELIIRAIAEDVAARKQRTGQDIRPVILMPVPTYGFFFSNPERWGIEIAKIPRDMGKGGQLPPEAIKAAFHQLQKDGKRIVAFYDSNPHNPLGLVREQAETESLYRLFAAISHAYEREDRAWLDKQTKAGRKGFASCKWDGLSSRVRIIDDMVYDGLEYGGQARAFPFALVKDDVVGPAFADCFTLFGTSKAGLANIRAGLVIGPSRHLDTMRDLQRMTGYSPPKTAIHALHAYFNDQAPFSGWRQRHLKKMNTNHEFNGRLMKALINGLDQPGEAASVPVKERTRMIRVLADATSLSPAQAQAWLERGTDGAHIISTPQAGFFHMLDLGAWRGKFCTYPDLSGPYRDGRLLDTIYATGAALNTARLHLATAGWCGLDGDNDHLFRVTYAKPVSEIAQLARRLQRLHNHMRPPPAERISLALTA